MTKSTVSRSRAIRRLLKNIRLRETVLASPHEAIGLIASHDICAYCDVPEQACSVRDGYALRTENIEKASPMEPVKLAVTQIIRAESRQANSVNNECAARVLTGGLVPPCADAVLAEEDVEINGDNIFVRTPVRPGWFVRTAGGEIAQGDIIVRQGEVITPQAAAVMIRTRVSSVQVHPTPTTRVISLGSELSDPTCCGEECNTARFPADNLVLASGLLKQAGTEVTEKGVLPDIEGCLVEVLSCDDLPDIVITTGGTGRSERDFARSSAREAGFNTIFDHVDIRPGRNMFAAHKGDTLLFGLPGPPAAVFACFHAIVLPIIRALRGLKERDQLKARVKEGISSRPDGDWVVLCSLAQEGAEIIATPLSGKDVPPMLAIGLADGVAILSGGTSILPGGDVDIHSTQYKSH